MKSQTVIFTAIFTLSFFIITQAQDFYYGVQGGLNLADLDLQSASGTEILTSSRTEYGIGGIIGYKLDDHFALELEPTYLRKGGTQMANAGNPNIDITLSVLEIPLFMKASFGTTVRPYVKAGPVLGFVLSSEAESEQGGVVGGNASQTYLADLNNVIKNMDFGVTFGAGISFLAGKYTIFVDGRYSIGMIDLFQAGQIEWRSADDSFVVESNESSELSTKGLQIMAGMLIPF